MEDHQGPGGSPSLPVPPEGPTAPAALEPGKSGSSAHRHVSRRTGLSKLCQSRMALSGKQPLSASRVAPGRDGGHAGLLAWRLCSDGKRERPVGGSSWGSAGGSWLELKERARLGGEVWKAEEDLEGLGENVPLPEWTFRSDDERPCGWGAWEGSGTAGSSAFMLLCGGLGGPQGVLGCMSECSSSLQSPRPWPSCGSSKRGPGGV